MVNILIEGQFRSRVELLPFYSISADHDWLHYRYLRAWRKIYCSLRKGTKADRFLENILDDSVFLTHTLMFVYCPHDLNNVLYVYAILLWSKNERKERETSSVLFGDGLLLLMGLKSITSDHHQLMQKRK